MATEHKRMTLVIMPDMVKRLEVAKRKMFYDSSRSEMIRALIDAGLDAIQEKSNNKPA